MLSVGRRATLAVVVLAMLASLGAQTPVPPPVTSVTSCMVPLQTQSLRPQTSRAPKPASTENRKTRRGRVYEELWKHQAVAGRPRPAVAPLRPSVSAEDVGQISVIRDEGDIIQPANPFDLRSTAVQFSRNGSGGYDLRRSDRVFQSSVGNRIPLDDDASARIALPFTLPFYAARYTELFVNSDGNVTFGAEDHASTARSVARFLTGPPRIAPIFDDLDPSQSGGIYMRTEIDAVVVTWCGVPEYDNATNLADVQLRLNADGSIEFVYGVTATPTSAVVGVSPGDTGIFSAVNVSGVSSAPIAGGSGALGERFSAAPDLDFVALTGKFYQTHGDDYDQFVLFTNARTTPTGAFAYEFTVANEIQGIGQEVFDFSRSFGSAGRLRSLVNMDRLARFPDDPRQRLLGENNTLSVLGQEAGHRWLAYLGFRDGRTSSTELLGRDEAHWSFFFDSDASVMEGNDIDDLGNGQFRTVGAVSRYSALDQYVMGLRAASDVPPMFLVTAPTAGGTPKDAPRVGVSIRGTRKTVQIADIVAANGARRPDTSVAPKVFRQAWLYLVAAPETTEDLNQLERIRSAWETFFSDATEGRGTMNARLR